MATSKKTAPKRKVSARPVGSAADSLIVLVMTWAFTVLSVVFAAVAYWRYA